MDLVSPIVSDDDIEPAPKKQKLDSRISNSTPTLAKIIRSTPKDRSKKNTPLLRKGDHFKWAENPSYRDIGDNPFKLGVATPQYLKITLKTTGGDEISYER